MSFFLKIVSDSSRKKRNTDEVPEIYIDKILNPEKVTQYRRDVNRTKQAIKEIYKRLNLDKSYKSIFELMWYSQLPCFDVANITTRGNEELALIKQCMWKGRRISCPSIFSMQPTDRGMCCSFNKEKAEKIFKNSPYQQQIINLTHQDKRKSFENSTVPDWFDPTPEAGRSKGLTIVLDGHSDLISASSIPDFTHGFEAIVDGKGVYPLTSREHILIRPGHLTEVGIGALKITPDPNIKSVDPLKRNCYFSDEYPPNQPLRAHQKYSQLSCTLECRMRQALMDMGEDEKCTPWYLPPVDPDARLCSPFEAIKFNHAIDTMAANVCEFCLPDCDVTQYSTSVSAAPFRPCDFRNIGLSPACNLSRSEGGEESGFGMVSPPMWGASVIEEYRGKENIVPHYINERQMDNRRKYAKTVKQRDSAVFPVTNDMDETYDAYEKDIAIVSFYFKEPAVLEFSREARMTQTGFIAQVGGLMGLCLGFSFLSLIELIYWTTYRMARNFRN